MGGHDASWCRDALPAPPGTESVRGGGRFCARPSPRPAAARPPVAGTEGPWRDLFAERPRRPRRVSAAMMRSRRPVSADGQAGVGAGDILWRGAGRRAGLWAARLGRPRFGIDDQAQGCRLGPAWGWMSTSVPGVWVQNSNSECSSRPGFKTGGARCPGVCGRPLGGMATWSTPSGPAPFLVVSGK